MRPQSCWPLERPRLKVVALEGAEGGHGPLGFLAEMGDPSKRPRGEGWLVVDNLGQISVCLS